MTNRAHRERLEAAIARIADPAGEGARACLTVYADEARLAADAADGRKAFGHELGPLDGRIVTVKDLFDVKGEPTRGGSKIRAGFTPAAEDAVIVRRLRAAGAVIVAKTNMTEFAFSAMGINPHYGTPGNPTDRTRVPGGSSSGAAVAAADHMCDIAIGTDTGGSCRIPASFCGVVGYKPSARLVPRDGALALSYTLDSIGPLALSVADCALTHAVLAGEEPAAPARSNVAGLRLGILVGPLLDDLDDTVGRTFEASCNRLAAAGARVTEFRTSLLAEMQTANAKGGFSAAEALSVHGEYFETREGDFDSRVWQRIAAARSMTAADYVSLARERPRLIHALDAELSAFDAVILPSTPNVAPVIAQTNANDEAFFVQNARGLRNTAFANFFDLCAISLPMPTGGLPAGLQLVGRNGADRSLFAHAAAIESTLRP
ncbi:aspartyl-tRNA(Asn)/glutamyl-tRNA(Gln) amidotransferase subunit A [Rhizobiales bacterium GAS113]|nr:aspartyl-tRNA(Asn)/glutamyl-tRNA(Gln) amidotransferase subunit A [Rhizobiales bacterium GAS113]